jgi:hypothetical protein
MPLASEAVRDATFSNTAFESSTKLYQVKSTVLSSRKNSLLSVYDVSGNKNGLLQSHALPYSLSGRFPSGPHAGFYVAHPHPESGNTTASLVQLTSHGGIYMNALVRQNKDTTPLPVTVDVSWSSAVHRLATTCGTQKTEIDKLGARAMQEFDFRQAYQRIIISHFGLMLSHRSKPRTAFQDCFSRSTPQRLSMPQKVLVLSIKHWI